jgi:GTPase SAR1 family protein
MLQFYVTKLFNSYTEPHTNGFLQVGKTSIVSRYTGNVFDGNYKPTIGHDFHVMHYNLSTQCCLINHLQERKLEAGNCKVKLHIWDTAVEERFPSVSPFYYNGAYAICCIFDVTNRCV